MNVICSLDMVTEMMCIWHPAYFTVEPCVKVCTAYKRTTNSLTNGISLKPNDCFCEVNMTAATGVAGWKSCFLQEKIIAPTGNLLLILFVFDFPFYLTMAIHS